MNIRGREERLVALLSPLNLAPNPSHFLFFSRRTYSCKRELSERERAHSKKRTVLSFMKEDRALAAVALSAPASPAINPPLSRACARRSGRCVGAHFKRFTRGLLCSYVHARMHTSTHNVRARVRPRFMLAHRISSEHEKIERDWEANKREGVEEGASNEAEAKWVHFGYDNYPVFHCYLCIDSWNNNIQNSGIILFFIYK